MAPPDSQDITLDLRLEGERPGELGDRYDAIAAELREPYSRWIGEMGESVNDSLDWWLEASATRNPVFSGLYHQVVSLLLLQSALAAGERPHRIRVDSAAMASAVHALLPDDAMTVIGPGRVEQVKTSLLGALSPLRSMIRLTREWRAARRGRHRHTLPADTILVDTFAIPGFVERDRYYPGLLDLAGEASSRLLFVPQFFNLTPAEIRDAAARLPSKRYLIKESWLGWWDMLWCFGHWFRRRGSLPPKAIFRGLDLSALVRADVRRGLGFRCAVRGLMNYRFARALARAGAKPGLVIDWFENHPMDRGWNAGFNRWFAEVPRRGYSGFFPAGMSYRPTTAEQRAGILPPDLLLIGTGFAADMGEFLPQLRSATAPAFRYPQWPQQAVETTVANDGDNAEILVAMPYYDAMCRAVLGAIAAVQPRRPQWRFVIKAHPATPLTRFAESQPVMAAGAMETAEPLAARLATSTAMITGSQASTILESAALGVPAVILHKAGSPAEVSIPRAMPADLIRVSHDGDELLEALDELLTNRRETGKALEDLALTFQQRCFTPVNRETVAAMLAA